MPETKNEFEYISYYTPTSITDELGKDVLFQKLFVKWAGLYKHAEGHYVKERTLKEHVLVYCIEGRGELEIEGESWSIEEGDLFICPGGVPHTYRADTKYPWSKYWIHFQGEDGDLYMDNLGITIKNPILHVGKDKKIVSWMWEIMNNLKMGYTKNNFIMASSYLNLILSYLITLQTKKMPGQMGFMNIERIIQYMLSCVEQDLTLDELSEVTSISKYHLVRIFGQSVGYTPMDYFIRLKIQRACTMLEIPGIKVSDISERLSFGSPYYFSKVFKKIMGVPPTQYRSSGR